MNNTYVRHQGERYISNKNTGVKRLALAPFKLLQFGDK